MVRRMMLVSFLILCLPVSSLSYPVEIPCGKKKVVLLGTRHKSKRSITAVESYIAQNKVDCTVLELDIKRWREMKALSEDNEFKAAFNALEEKGRTMTHPGQTICPKIILSDLPVKILFSSAYISSAWSTRASLTRVLKSIGHTLSFIVKHDASVLPLIAPLFAVPSFYVLVKSPETFLALPLSSLLLLYCFYNYLIYPRDKMIFRSIVRALEGVPDEGNVLVITGGNHVGGLRDALFEKYKGLEPAAAASNSTTLNLFD